MIAATFSEAALAGPVDILLNNKFTLQYREKLIHALFHFHGFQRSVFVAGAILVKNLPWRNVLIPKFLYLDLESDKTVFNPKEGFHGFSRAEFMDRDITKCAYQAVEYPFVVGKTDSKMPGFIVVSQIWELFNHRHNGGPNRQNGRLPLPFSSSFSCHRCVVGRLDLRRPEEIRSDYRRYRTYCLHPSRPFKTREGKSKAQIHHGDQDHQQHQADKPISFFHAEIIGCLKGILA